MVKEGPGLLEMQVALCFALSIVMEMLMHTCGTTRTTPISQKCLRKSTSNEKENEIVKAGEITTEESKKWRGSGPLNNHSIYK